MITPPQIIFYLSLIIILGRIYKIFFNKETNVEEELISIVAGIYLFMYLIVYMIINYSQ